MVEFVVRMPVLAPDLFVFGIYRANGDCHDVESRSVDKMSTVGHEKGICSLLEDSSRISRSLRGQSSKSMTNVVPHCRPRIGCSACCVMGSAERKGLT